MYDPHPPWHNIGKQLSRRHVNKGFPYMDDGTKPLCGQTLAQFLKKLSGPHVYKGFPNMEPHTKQQTKPLCRQT